MDNTQRAGLYSIGVNVFLAGLKLGLALPTNSLALAADGVHSLTDVIASAVVLVGLLIAKRRTRDFPYGLYKVENIVAVILALLIFLTGYEIVHEALTTPVTELREAPLALTGAAIAIVAAHLFSRYERRIGEKHGSPSLIADSQHFRSDMLASGVVFASVLGTALGLPLDRAGAIIVALFIARAGWGLLVDGMRVLLDASLDYGTLAQVRQIIEADRNVADIKSLVGRNSGRYKFIEVELTLRARDLEKAHGISARIETAIKKEIPRVDRVMVHYEPLRKEVLKWAVPLESPVGNVSPHLGQAPYFALVEIRPATGEVVEGEVLANPYLDLDKQKGIRAAQFLLDQGIDGLVMRESLDRKGPYYVLADAGREVVQTQKETLDEVLQDLNSISRNL